MYNFSKKNLDFYSNTKFLALSSNICELNTDLSSVVQFVAWPIKKKKQTSELDLFSFNIRLLDAISFFTQLSQRDEIINYTSRLVGIFCFP